MLLDVFQLEVVAVEWRGVRDSRAYRLNRLRSAMVGEKTCIGGKLRTLRRYSKLLKSIGRVIASKKTIKGNYTCRESSRRFGSFFF